MIFWLKRKFWFLPTFLKTIFDFLFLTATTSSKGMFGNCKSKTFNSISIFSNSGSIYFNFSFISFACAINTLFSFPPLLILFCSAFKASISVIISLFFLSKSKIRSTFTSTFLFLQVSLTLVDFL